MAGIFATIVFFGSLLGLAAILFRKIPLLVELPETPKKFSFKKAILEFKTKIKTLNPFKDFSSEIFLQKILSRIRIFVLRIENKIASSLQKLRERSLRKKAKENDNYWERITKANKKK